MNPQGVDSAKQFWLREIALKATKYTSEFHLNKKLYKIDHFQNETLGNVPHHPSVAFAAEFPSILQGLGAETVSLDFF